MEPHDLIEKHLNGDLSEEEAKVLADWLREDRAHVEEFVRATHVHSSLQDVMAETGEIGPAGRVAVLTARPRWNARRIIPLAAALVLALVGLYATHRLSSGSRVVARVTETSEGVIIVRGAKEVIARPGNALLRGDRIHTGAAQRISLAYRDGRTRAELGSHSTLEMWGEGNRCIVLKQGDADISVARRLMGKPFVVETPHAKVDVLGTTFLLSVSHDATRLDMEDGIARLTHLGRGASREVYRWGYGYAEKGLDLMVFPPEGQARWVKTVRKLDVAIPPPRGPGVAWDGSSLWFTRNKPPALYRVDPESGKVLKKFDISSDFKRIGNMAWTGTRLIVSGQLHDTYRGSEVCVMDPETGKILEKLPSPVQLDHVSAFKSVAFDGELLWTVLPQGGRIDAIDADTGETRETHHVPHPDIRTLAHLGGAFWTTGEQCLYKMDGTSMQVVDFYRNHDTEYIRDITGAGGSLLWMAGPTFELILVNVNKVSDTPDE
jgi:ferric-dicitrate binding protein FerR (iron transport regulator)